MQIPRDVEKGGKWHEKKMGMDARRAAGTIQAGKGRGDEPRAAKRIFGCGLAGKKRTKKVLKTNFRAVDRGGRKLL